MTNKSGKRPTAAVAKRDEFSDWLIPPVMIPAFLALAVAAYVFYRVAA